VETKTLINILEFNGLHILADKFLQISYESGKWEKWMLESTKASDRDKSLIAGHYVFSHPVVKELKIEADRLLGEKGISLNSHLKHQVKLSIMRYLRHFRLVRSV
jgi:hypothetical protein